MVASGPPPELSTTHVLRTRGPVILLVRRDWEAALPVADLLAGAPLTAWGRPLPHALSGRGPVEVLDTDRGALVAKRLTRGGLLGGVLRRSFADPWRCAREAAVAEALAARGCPTPPVVVARAVRRGLLYRLELATARVEGARDLLAALRAVAGERAAEAALAEAVGATLRRLHDEGLHHRDLQVKNLLVPEAGPPRAPLPVIDLDRCVLGAPLDEDRRVASLARFARSLVKHRLLPRRGDASGARAVGGAVRAFLTGYGRLPASTRTDLARRVTGRLRRELVAHQWRWALADGDLADRAG